MTRIPQITERDRVSDEHQPVFDAIAESRGGVGGPFSLLLNSPEVAGRVAHLGSYIRFESTLAPPQLELAIITAAREFDCSYEWSAHAVLAAKAGVRDECIEAVANRGPVESLTDEEATIISYGRQLLGDHRVSDATFDAANNMLGVQGVTELTATFGYYGMMACVLNAFELEPAPGTPTLP